MKKILLLSFGLMLLLFQQAVAQNRTVSGRVTDRQTGEGLPGVTVLLKGTTNGASTNADGTFSLNLPEGTVTLVFSSVNFITQERQVSDEAQINVSLVQDVKQLSEVVVTALGIEKDSRQLGYATQQIRAEQISQKAEPNVLNALQGKVSGVTITNSSGLPGSSTNINIRGIGSLQGSNQPLFVVNGIPVSNDLDRTNGGPLGSLGGAQSGNRAVDIDPENIESISILKGPAAAALYGSRAAAGAILITTKSGRSVNKKLEVTVTSGYNQQRVYGLPKFQNEYGQGTGGINLTTNGAGDINTGSTNSWGPRFGTTPTQANGLLLANGQTLPYQAYPDNIKNFFKTGYLLTNGFNAAGGTAEQNFNISYNRTDQGGIVETADLSRDNLAVGGNAKLANKIVLSGSVTGIFTKQSGPLVGNGSSAFGQLINVPRSYDLQGLPYADANNRSVFFPGNDNPTWNLLNNPTTSDLTRFLPVASVGYDVRPWLNVTYRAGFDTYTDRRKQVFALGAARLPTGLVRDETFYRKEFTGDLLVRLHKENTFTEGFTTDLLLGQQVNTREFQRVSSQADNLLVSGFPNASVGSVFSNGTGEESSVRRLLGYYGQLTLSYNNNLTLELTGRVDRSSTLPKANNTYFYPSAAISFVFTDAFDIKSKIFSYGKIRGNVAQVGRDTDPYNLVTTYAVTNLGNNVANLTFPFNGSGGFTLSNTAGNADLLPEFTRSAEGGLVLGFIENKVTVDVTYFNQVSEQSILPLTTPGSTGILSRFANAGRLVNKGIEALVNINPVRTENFRWDITGNFTRLRNTVEFIAEGVTQSSINGSAFTGTIPSFREGAPYGVIIGSRKRRVTSGEYAGQYIIDGRTGLFVAEEPNQILADPNFKWQAGLTNSFNYKGLNLSFLVDTNQGGEIVSFTNGFYKSRGALKETAENREAPRVIPGVIQVGSNPDGTPIYRPNNIQVDAQNYWASFGLQSDLNVYDATVYRLREVTLGYSLPKSLLSSLPFGDVNLSLSGRNLFYYAPNANFDPEVNTQGAGNIRGLDLQGPPNVRTYGVNLRFTL